ncbi:MULTISPECIES: hypothetical protein [Cyanophyceae]|uniref:hypothetical protein n=1 Tax=Cyanophyceae TaxID=3028117 RepID=UPI0018EFCE91|nr:MULTISPECIES: hypothetical protein [Cyanophyceae]
MFVTSSDPNSNSSLTKLPEYNSKASLQKKIGRSPHPLAAAPTQPDTRLADWAIDPVDLDQPQSHQGSLRGSSPSTALRGRDLEALEELFEHEEIEEVQADVLRNLEWMSPELCWEDDPFDFLREYL